jgi:hypothetical protein
LEFETAKQLLVHFKLVHSLLHNHNNSNMKKPNRNLIDGLNHSDIETGMSSQCHGKGASNSPSLNRQPIRRSSRLSASPSITSDDEVFKVPPSPAIKPRKQMVECPKCGRTCVGSLARHKVCDPSGLQKKIRAAEIDVSNTNQYDNNVEPMKTVMSETQTLDTQPETCLSDMESILPDTTASDQSDNSDNSMTTSVSKMKTSRSSRLPASPSISSDDDVFKVPPSPTVNPQKEQVECPKCGRKCVGSLARHKVCDPRGLRKKIQAAEIDVSNSN